MTKPRVGFLGTGWIGRHRMEAVLGTRAVDAVAVCDPSPECAAEALRMAPGAVIVPSLSALLDCNLDGLVIATPSAHHAEQAIAALDAGVAVFCQKPLGRNEVEARAVVAAAEASNRLLSVDFSYRLSRATERLAELVRAGELGKIFAIDLVFHNAYGPDKPWFYDRTQSGGGCVIDLGVHLVDLALWLTDFPQVELVTSRLFAAGQPLAPGASEVEDFATARLDLAGGVSARLTCSWRLHAGADAIIETSVYGTLGGATIRNIGGSFFDFELLHHRGTHSEQLVSPPDEWGGRAAARWAEQLASDGTFDPEALRLPEVSSVVDRIYGTLAHAEN